MKIHIVSVAYDGSVTAIARTDIADLLNDVLDNHGSDDVVYKFVPTEEGVQAIIEQLEDEDSTKTYSYDVQEVPLPKIELLHSRDPDSACVIEMWIDSEPTSAYIEESIDPGAGHQRSEWDQYTADVEADPNYSEAFKATVVAARNEVAEYSKYIEED